jgi:hypothetical protein
MIQLCTSLFITQYNGVSVSGKGKAEWCEHLLLGNFVGDLAATLECNGANDGVERSGKNGVDTGALKVVGLWLVSYLYCRLFHYHGNTPSLVSILLLCPDHIAQRALLTVSCPALDPLLQLSGLTSWPARGARMGYVRSCQAWDSLWHLLATTVIAANRAELETFVMTLSVFLDFG